MREEWLEMKKAVGVEMKYKMLREEECFLEVM